METTWSDETDGFLKTSLKKMRQDETRKDAIDFENFPQEQILKAGSLCWSGFLDSCTKSLPPPPPPTYTHAPA